MKYFLAITLLAVLTNYSAGLECWLCIGSLTSDCFRGEEHAMVVQDCSTIINNAPTPESPEGLKDYDVAGDDNRVPDVLVSTCVSFLAEENGSQMVRRGCDFMYAGRDICEYAGESVQMCESCHDDKCNSQPKGQTV